MLEVWVMLLASHLFLLNGGAAVAWELPVMSFKAFNANADSVSCRYDLVLVVPFILQLVEVISRAYGPSQYRFYSWSTKLSGASLWILQAMFAFHDSASSLHGQQQSNRHSRSRSYQKKVTIRACTIWQSQRCKEFLMSCMIFCATPNDSWPGLALWQQGVSWPAASAASMPTLYCALLQWCLARRQPALPWTALQLTPCQPRQHSQPTKHWSTSHCFCLRCLRGPGLAPLCAVCGQLLNWESANDPPACRQRRAVQHFQTGWVWRQWVPCGHLGIPVTGHSLHRQVRRRLVLSSIGDDSRNAT